jgi:F-type H+-transporting ATPase subunit a
VTGAIGSRFLGTNPLSPQPAIHLPPQPVFPPQEQLEPMKFTITNTILASWFTTACLLLLFYFAARKPKPVPGRLQGMVEGIMEFLLNMIEGAIGKERARTVFPLVATIFLFVGFNAWLSILPFFGPIGYKDAQGAIAIPLLRNASTDINLPLAVALVAVITVEFWGMRAVGALRYVGQFVNVRRLLRGQPMGLADLFVGALEALSHLIRIISFTFRLFGNMTAGKALVLIIAFILPFLGFGIYGLELLIGLIQALIFAGLTMVFAAVAVLPHEEETH